MVGRQLGMTFETTCQTTSDCSRSIWKSVLRVLRSRLVFAITIVKKRRHVMRDNFCSPRYVIISNEFSW